MTEVQVQLLKVEEAAKIAGIPRSQAYDYIARLEWDFAIKLPHTNRLRVPADKLQEWIDRQKQQRTVALLGV